MVGFNPRPRTGSDIPIPGRRSDQRVSIHAPARGATGEGCAGSHRLATVSIHAPARGATRERHECHASGHHVSIHAPARGATGVHRNTVARIKSFNPRPRTGSDIPLQDHPLPLRSVSIHAPARGATYLSRTTLSHYVLFQSTPPHGERRGIDLLNWVKSWFQSTPPHGERHPSVRGCEVSGLVSIHAPARGATQICLEGRRSWWSFNPRPRTGSDVVVPPCFRGRQVSIHAPARGATRRLP